MADNVTLKTGDTPSQSVQMKTKEISAGLHLPGFVQYDEQANAVSMNVARDLNNGLKVSVWLGDQNKPIVPVTINNPWAARVDNNQEYPFSSYNFLPIVSYGFAFDAERTVSGQKGSERRIHMPTGASQRAANDASPSYQGLTRPCQLFRLRATVSGSANIYLKIWDRNSAPTVGTDAPTYTVPVPFGNVNMDLDGLGLQSGYYYTFHTTYSGTTLVAAGTVTDLLIVHG